MEKHLEICVQRPRKCTFDEVGCSFIGNPNQIQEHVADESIQKQHIELLSKKKSNDEQKKDDIVTLDHYKIINITQHQYDALICFVCREFKICSRRYTNCCGVLVCDDCCNACNAVGGNTIHKHHSPTCVHNFVTNCLCADARANVIITQARFVCVCGDTFTQDQVESHTKLCKAITACTYCKADIPACFLMNHLETCVQRPRKCMFYTVGCAFVGNSSQIQAHITNNLIQQQHNNLIEQKEQKKQNDLKHGGYG
jgi:hypothetical protein